MSDEREAVPVGLDTKAHNEWVESLKADVEWKPLRDFLDRLKEPEVMNNEEKI